MHSKHFPYHTQQSHSLHKQEIEKEISEREPESGERATSTREKREKNFPLSVDSSGKGERNAFHVQLSRRHHVVNKRAEFQSSQEQCVYLTSEREEWSKKLNPIYECNKKSCRIKYLQYTF
jgi:hypothetical protein